jgi:tetratricopeptide (TPR) repeat protein
MMRIPIVLLKRVLAPLACIAALTAGTLPTTDARIARYEKLVTGDPGDIRFQKQLAAAYLQKTRETSDYSYVERAARIIDRILEGNPADYESLSLRNQIEMNRHNFSRVADYAREMARIAPDDLQNWAMLGDALMEMGEYESAAQAYARMAALRPGLFSYNRLAFHRFVAGDSAGAIALMEKAAASGSPNPENTAWCLTELGNMYFKAGRLDDAERAFLSALEAFPASHTAHAGMGSVQAARGRRDDAIASYQKAQAAIPMPAYAAALHDLYTAGGDARLAQQQAGLIDVIVKMEIAGNQKADRMLALILANQGRNLTQALELAQADFAVRKDVYTRDALAWVLYKLGRYDEASQMIHQALAFQTPEPLFFYHAGMIAHALGRSAEARENLQRALALNPNFDVAQSAIAGRTLKQLGMH